MITSRLHTHPLCLALFAFQLAAANLASAAHPLDHWTWRNPTPGGYSLWAITYGAGQYVGVGEHGAVAISLDGATWRQQISPTYEWLTGVAFGDGQFVAVGGSGTILTSRDAMSWTSRVSPTNMFLHSVAWHAGLFVAVGSYGTLFTSTDGITWTARNPATDNSLLCVTYGDRFVAVGGEGAIVSSVDGVTWTPGLGTGNQSYHEIVYANGRYVAAAAYGRYATSSDGVHWIVSPDRKFAYFGTMAAGNGFFVAIPDGVVHTSRDGLTWHARQPVSAGAITYGGDQFVVAGLAAGATSPDGVNWTTRSFGGYETFSAIAVHDERMVVAGDGAFLASTNGIDWVRTASAAYRGRGLIWADGRFVSVGSSGQIFTSTNGVDWVSQLSPTYSQLEGIAWGNGQLVVVGSGFLVSSNERDWRVISTDVIWWKDVTYADGRFVAVGDHGKLAVSTNALDWTIRTIDYDEGFNGIAYGNGVWVAVGELATTRYSTNLVDWFPAEGSALLHTIFWANGVFLGGGRNGWLVSSTNGADWTRRTASFGYLLGLAWHHGSFWAVGDAGMVQQSDPWVETAPSLVHQPVGVVGPAGTTVTLEVGCEGTPPFSFQWTKDGSLVPDATNVLLVLTNLQSGQAGNYRVTVSNSVGVVMSDPAAVSLAPPEDATPRLAISSSSAGLREFTLKGRPANRYRISYTQKLGSSNSWTLLKTLALPRIPPFAPFVWTDETATNAPQRFYRAEAP